LARSIVDAANEKELVLSEVSNFDSVTGGGVHGTVDGKQVLIGKQDLLRDKDVEGIESMSERAIELQNQGRTVMFASIDGKFAGIIAVSDPIKKTSSAAIKTLHKLGIKVAMLTGDNERTAKSVADQLNIDEVEAGVSPEDKHNRVKQLQSSGHGHRNRCSH